MRNGPVIQTSFGPMQWSAPFNYANVVFDGAGMFPGSTKYHDASKRVNHGTLVNSPTWQWVPELGRWGINYVRTSSQSVGATGRGLPSLQSGPWTVAVWERPADVASTFQRRVSIADGSWNLQIVNQGTTAPARLHLRNGAAANVVPVADFAVDAEVGVLRHRAAVFNGSTYSVFTDGVLGSGTATAHSMGGYLTAGIYQGHRGDASGYFSGSLTGLIFCNTALSPAAIRWLANRNNLPWQLYKPKRYWLASAAPATLEIYVHDCADASEALH